MLLLKEKDVELEGDEKFMEGDAEGSGEISQKGGEESSIFRKLEYSEKHQYCRHKVSHTNQATKRAAKGF